MRLFTGVCGRGILRSSHKRNSRKFTVASNPSGVAPSPRYQHGGTPSASKRSDLVLFVAPFRIKGLRLVTALLPKKLRPSDRGYGLGRCLTSEQPTRYV